MEITVFASDLKPKFKKEWDNGTLKLKAVRLHMFKAAVQRAIKTAGSATFRSDDLYQRIKSPK